MRRTVVLEAMGSAASDTTRPSGSSYRAIHVDDDGTLTIEGHDLGDGVERFWGEGHREYEFARTLGPGAVTALRLALGLDATAPLPEALVSSVGPPNSDLTHRLEQLIEQHGIDSEFWSRVGD